MIEQASCLIVEHRIEKILRDLFDFCGDGLDLDFFLCHAYKISQPRKNARDFFRLKNIFFQLDSRLGTLLEQVFV